MFQESIVNQDNINKISLAEAGRNPRLGQGISSDDCSARTHTEGGAWTHSVSLRLLFVILPPHPPVIPTQRHRRIHRSDKARQQRRRNRDRNWPKGAFLSAYLHQFQHSIKGTSSPYGLNFQSQNPEAGLFQRPWTDGFHPSTLLSSFIFLSTRNSR